MTTLHIIVAQAKCSPSPENERMRNRFNTSAHDNRLLLVHKRYS